MRTVGTDNLLTAARLARAERFLAQSIAWTPARGGQGVEAHERMVLDAGGVVIRYGQLYGPGTYYEHELPSHPRIQVDQAARKTVELLDAPNGVVILAEDDG